jgi:predicted enzyme related to lactoylglutathione lyase
MATTPSRFIRHDLMCTDVAAGVRFYCGLFGWKTVEVKFMGSTIQRLLAGERVLGAIIPFDKSLGHPSHWVPYVYVESVDDCCKRVRALGGQVCMGATDFPPGTFAMVNDPEKALFSPFTPKGGPPSEPPPAPGPGEFCWDELLTNDVAAAREFYQKLFGWESSEWDVGSAGTYMLFMIDETPVAGMLKLPEGAPQPPNWLPYVAVDDADATVAKARALGGQIALPPMDIPDVGRIAALIDPTSGHIAILKRE